MKKIEYIIKPDGQVDIHPLSGFDNTSCQTETQAVEQALGRVSDRRPDADAEPQYRAPTVRQKWSK